MFHTTTVRHKTTHEGALNRGRIDWLTSHRCDGSLISKWDNDGESWRQWTHGKLSKQNPSQQQTCTNDKTHTHHNQLIRPKSWQYLPPRRATWHTQEGLASSPTEVLNQGLIQNVPGRNPTPLLWTITLPVHQKLETPTTASNVQELSHSVNWSTIHYTRGRWGQGRTNRVKGGMKHRLNLGHVKDRVNPTKRVRKLEPHCRRTQDLGDAIWPNEPGCQLTRRHPERQVLGGKPYFLTTHVRRSRSPATISRCFGPSGSPGQDLLSPFPGATTPTDEG